MVKILIKKEDAVSDYYPPDCMLCGEREATNIETRDFSSPHYPPWVFLGCLLGLAGIFLTAFIGSFYRKKHPVSLRLCDQCYLQYKRTPIWTAIVITLCTLIFIAMIMFFGNDQPSLGMISILLCFVIPITAYFLFYRKYSITCSNIDDSYIALNIPNENYAIKYNDFVCSHPRLHPQEFSPQVQGMVSRNVVYCNSCGYPNKMGGKFCVKCGEPLMYWGAVAFRLPR